MRFFVFCSIHLMVLCCFHVEQSKADYSVRNLAVDVTGKSAIDAKDKAFIEARANAFNIIIKRQYGMEVSESIQTPPDDVILKMVDSIEINREKASPKRYLASLNITFNKQAVERYFSYVTATKPYQSYASELSQDNSLMIDPMSNQSLIRSRMVLDLSSLNNWVQLQQSIESMELVEHLTVEKLSINRAIFTVLHHGTINQLQMAFIRNGLKLFNNPGDDRVIIPYVLGRAG